MEEVIVVTFGHRLRSLRRRNFKTLEMVSNDLGYSISQLSKWELDKTVPHLDNIWVFADYYKVSIDYIVGRRDE